MDNPFNTTFGIAPNNYIKRIKESQKIIDDFSSESPSNYVYLITGLRGCGKTVLLSSIADKFNNDDNWIVVDPGPKDNILENIASEIYEVGKLKKLFLKSEFSFSFHGLTFSLEGKEPVTSAITLIRKMLDYLSKKNKRILITIDEVDNSNQMKYFIQAYQTLLRQKYKIMLLMTGLYENISKLQEDKSLTFLYRATKIYLEPLNINSIASSYKNNFKIDFDMALSLAKQTKGYAYAYQLLGYLLYQNKVKKLEEVEIDFDQCLSEYVYEKIYFEMSEKEKEIIESIPSNEKIKVSELTSLCNINPKILSVYRDRLIKKGILFSPSYGYLEFSLPRFYEFVQSKI